MDGKSGAERGAGPFVRARLVKLRDVPALLPAGSKRVDAAGLAAQLAERARYPVGLWTIGCGEPDGRP